jgi:hypothetical protein
MRQVSKHSTARKKTVRKKYKVNRIRPKFHKQQYGTSKLERDFAEMFLDKLGIDYIYEFEAKEIGRFYDFAIVKGDNLLKEDKHGLKSVVQNGKYYLNMLIEVDGDYFHSKDTLYEDMTPTQKKNRRVDSYKNEWALKNGIKLIRIWECDIRNNPKKVMEFLKNEFNISENKRLLTEKRKKGLK